MLVVRIMKLAAQSGLLWRGKFKTLFQLCGTFCYLKYSKMFDAGWYESNYSTPAKWRKRALEHYILQGYMVGYWPNPYFDPVFYLKGNSDVLEFPFEPLTHYLQKGWKEGRQPNQWFDPAWYSSHYPDVARSGMEPLRHYIRYGRGEGRRTSPRLSGLYDMGRWGKTSSTGDLVKLLTLLDFPPRRQYQVKHGPVDVIIPIFNGMQYLKKLFDSLLACTDMTFRLIVIDDCSSDSQVFPYLEARLAEFNNAVLLRNKRNLGFVASVMRGVSVSQWDFVILNSDVVVPKEWLWRLMLPIWAERETVASTTPFSNSATIFSFPVVCADNELPDDLQMDRVDDIFSSMPVGKGVDLSAPTGVGFCMGINRKAWDSCGGLDEMAFSKGYGEENDWCQRLISEGWRHELVPNLFVHHVHGGSFSSDKKQALLRKNLKVLSKRWPNYFPSVREHCEKDPWKGMRDWAMLRLLLTAERRPILVVDHGLGGGTNSYRWDREVEWLKDGRTVVTIVCNLKNHLLMQWRVQGAEGWESQFCGGWEDSIHLIKRLPELGKLSEIFLNSMVNWALREPFLDALIELKKVTSARLTFPLHDYYALCPSYTLWNHRGTYCGLPDHAVCRECLPCNAYADGPGVEECAGNVEQWQRFWGKLLESADTLITFSKASARLLATVYPKSAEKIEVIPHRSLGSFEGKWITPAGDGKMVIGIVGGISEQKGAKALKALDTMWHREGVSIRIVVIGELAEVGVSNRVKVTGGYRREELPTLLSRHKVEVALVPSVWPETFCYVVQELMMIGVPVACFDLGAPAERVAGYEKGLVLPLDLDVAAKRLPEWILSMRKSRKEGH